MREGDIDVMEDCFDRILFVHRMFKLESVVAIGYLSDMSVHTLTPSIDKSFQQTYSYNSRFSVNFSNILCFLHSYDTLPL
jgi:hypothetical protein